MPSVSTERRGTAYLRALWGDDRPVSCAPAREPHDGGGARSRFDEGAVVLAAGADPLLAQASLAHMGAHRFFGAGRFPVGTLKPAQIALVSLVEDARVERLALAVRPGLRRLWLPFHVTGSNNARTAPDLMARLARALLDPDYADPDPWIAKGRAMFGDDPDRWRDPALSRQIGNLLGNDLGQMRVPFSGRNYRVAPAYRDDNSGLWEQPAEAAAPVPAPGRTTAPADETLAPSRGETPAPPPEPGIVSRYPEWDYRIRTHRPDWVTLTENAAPPAETAEAATTTGEGAAARALRQLLPRRPAWSRPSPDGETLDLHAALDAVTALRGGRPPEQRLYRRRVHPPAPLRVLILLDASQSTADPAPSGRGSVLDNQKAAALELAAALERLGLDVGLQAFRSNGRHDARAVRLKGWREGADLLRRRLAGLEPGLSTRLGAALRHAARTLGGAGPALLLVLTDGEPSDIDIYDGRYLVEDAREACRALARDRIAAYAVALSRTQQAPLARIFGQRRTVALYQRG